MVVGADREPALRELGIRLVRLDRRAPERGPDRHRRELAVGVLRRPPVAVDLVLLSQPRIEDPAEVDVVGVSAGGEDHPVSGADGESLSRRLVPLVHRVRREAEDPARRGLLPDEGGHPVLQDDLDSLRPRALLERPHEARSALCGHDDLAGHGPLAGRRAPEYRVVPARPPGGHPLHPVLGQEVKGRDRVLDVFPDDLPVVVAVARLVHQRPVVEDLLGGIVDPVLLLVRRAAPEVAGAATQDRPPPDVEVLLDEDDLRSLVPSRDRGGHPARAGSHDDDVHLPVPLDVLRLALQPARFQPAGGDADGRTRPECRTPLEELPPGLRPGRLLAHRRVLWKKRGSPPGTPRGVGSLWKMAAFLPGPQLIRRGRRELQRRSAARESPATHGDTVTET